MANMRNLGLPKVSRMSVIIGTLAVILGLIAALVGYQPVQEGDHQHCGGLLLRGAGPLSR